LPILTDVASQQYLPGLFFHHNVISSSLNHKLGYAA
jgi:hypothetical protein